MKKTIKQIFAWMIVLTLVFSAFPAAALAEEGTENAGHVHEEILEEITEEETEPSEEPVQEETPAAEEELPDEPAEEESPVEEEPAEEPEEVVEEPAPETDLTEETTPAEEETLPQEEEPAEPEEEVALMETNELCPLCGSPLSENDGKAPTYTEAGWEPYLSCSNEDCTYSTYKQIPALGAPSIKTYDEFIENLSLLEMVAQEFVSINPGKDPIALVIKYIRTGVDRYNSGSWGIMAGYEDGDFADFVRRMENQLNAEITEANKELPEEEQMPLLKISGLKDIWEFTLPNGDRVDFGHMFGTMDISYHNKGSVDHADVGGWAGDLVDLVSATDRAYAKSEESTVHFDRFDEDGNLIDLDTMIEHVSNSIFLKNTYPEDKFGMTDYYGDIDGMYVINTLYDCEYEAGMMAQIIAEYCTEELDDVDRADYFLNVRLGNSGTRAQVRAAVYDAYSGNKTITTLESTRDFQITDAAYLSQLRRACCYAYADYVCKLAGDYVEAGENPYYTDFESELSQLAPGITQEIHKATSADNKQMVYYLATADLSSKYVDVYANYNANDPSQGWKMARVLDQANAAQERHSDPKSQHYIPNYQVVAAVNADGFNMSTGEPGGLLVMEGKEWHPINAAGFFGITKDGEPVIGTRAEYNSIYQDELRDGVGAFGTMLVRDGEVAITATSNYYSDRASRTAVGITKTGKVVFMVLDGRQEPVSCGGSMIEIAQIMLEAGCEQAVNLDGGGSTTFVSKPEGQDELQVTSKPSDGYARGVSTSLIMVSTAPSSTAFDHAVLESEYSYATVGTPVQLTPKGVSATGNVAELPEGITWEVSDTKWAEVSQDGVFVGKGPRSIDVNLMLDGAVIGSKTITVLDPSNVYFTRDTLDAVYGSAIDLPVAAMFEGKPVAIKADDVLLTVSPERAGTFSGFTFTAMDEPEKDADLVKNAAVTVTLKANPEVSGSMTVRLFKQGENSFDFDQATAGDRQFAWLRTVSNSSTEDDITYTAVDRKQDMTTTYVFAMDMTQIPIPTQLNDLIFMLPGADDANASAWNFLLQLAERISVLTEVHPVMKFDPRFDVDYSELEVLNEYFYMDKEKSPPSFNPETNELSLTLYWHDQTKAIDAATANPLCMVKGIKLTPKANAFDSAERISVVNGGSIGYKIYLRANALYSFSQKPENQAKYGLLPFVNPDIPSESGGYFENVYKSFEDTYNLSYALRQGWFNEGGGKYAYYVDGEKLTGIQQVDGYYYDFGTDGMNIGQTKYTGMARLNGVYSCVSSGSIVKDTWILLGDTMYHCHSNGKACDTTNVTGDFGTCVSGTRNKYICSNCFGDYEAAYTMPSGHKWDKNHVCTVCHTKGENISGVTLSFSNGNTYVFDDKSIQPEFVAKDGETELTWSRNATLNDNGTLKDLLVSWTNSDGIGKASINFTGKGNYYGERQLVYYIIPDDPTDLAVVEGSLTANTVKLTWTKALGADSYNIYKVEGGKKTLVKNTTATSYVVTGLVPGMEYSFVVESAATSTDGLNKLYTGANPVSTASVRTLDNTEANALHSVAASGSAVTVVFNGIIPKEEIQTQGSWKVMVGIYDEDGKLIGIDVETVTGPCVNLTVPDAELADKLMAFVMDGLGQPRMKELEVKQ